MSAQPVVAVVDFPGSDAQERVPRLALKSRGVRLTYVMHSDRPREIDARAYGAALTSRIDAPVSDVLAYCGCAPIARELARHLDGRPPRPRVVVVNPEMPSYALVQPVIDEIARQLDPRPEPAPRVEHMAVDDFLDLERRLMDRYFAMMGVEPGVPREDQIPYQLAHMKIDWAMHMAAACAPGAPPPAADEVHFVSADHPCEIDCPAAHVQLGRTTQDLFAAGEEFWRAFGHSDRAVRA